MTWYATLYLIGFAAMLGFGGWWVMDLPENERDFGALCVVIVVALIWPVAVLLAIGLYLTERVTGRKLTL